MGKDDASAAPSDPRFSWVEERVVATLKVKADKFKRMLNTGDEKAALVKFFEDEGCMRVYFVDGTKDMFCYTTAPASQKKKMMWMLKAEPGQISAKNIAASVMVGDLSPKLLENMHQTLAGVFLPLISNPKNHSGWPEMIAAELVEVLHKTVAATYVALGQTEGKTLLPLPPDDMLAYSAGARSKENDRMHVLETSVVTWSDQIKGVIKTDFESVLLLNPSAGPGKGLDFWLSRHSNLLSIVEQLDGDKIRKVMRVLELTKSPYYQAFKTLCQDVRRNYQEAADNVLYLNCLKPCAARPVPLEPVARVLPVALQPRERPAPQNERPPKGVALRSGRPRLAHRGGGEKRRRVACVEERLEEPN